MSKMQICLGRFRLSAAPAALACAPVLCVTENVPHAPLGQWASVPEHGQLVVGPACQESRDCHFQAGDDRHTVDWRNEGEQHGRDINEGWLSLPRSLTKRQSRRAFCTGTVITGENTDKKFWIGTTLDMPFSLFKC